MTGQRMLLLEVMALLLLYCKNGSYVPLCLLPILIPAARFAGKWEKYLSVVLVPFVLDDAGYTGETGADPRF